MKLIRPLLIAVQFLTQCPVNFKRAPEQQEVGQSLVFYPLVGALIGAALYVVAVLFSSLPAMLTAALLLLIWVWITGALHLDGLADSADAWLGGRGDPQRTLEIMKDPAAGPIAVVVLVTLLLVKFSALLALLELQALHWLLLAPVLGRAALPVMLLTTSYVRQGGLGSWLVAAAPVTWVWISIIVTLSILGSAYGFAFAFVLLGASAVMWLCRRLMIKRIGGATGDTIGATLEIVEAFSLVLIIAVLSS